jgi:AraC family transcriptional regulator
VRNGPHEDVNARPGRLRQLNVKQITEAVGQRFHRPRVPTVIALARPSRIPIVISHVVSDVPMPEKTLAPPVEMAFAIHVHHRPLVSAETWIDGKHANLPPLVAGGICIFDLRTSPVALVREPFEFSRFQIARTTLDDLAYDHGLPRARDLRIPEFGHNDPTIHHLALAMITRIKMFGDEVDTLFADWIALAFHAHVVRAYGDVAERKPWRGALTPQRLRQVSGWMIEGLADPLSIPEIAAQINMAPGHFARAFRQATGQPPHRWLMDRRVERARDLLRSDMILAEIALACGFVDQSHLTRVFSHRERLTPAAWRRLNRS